MHPFAALFALCLSLGYLGAQVAPPEPRAIQVQPAPPKGIAGEARIALVIGNGAYGEVPLRNPPNDARAMGVVLEQCRFQVHVLVDASLAQMETGLRAFGEEVKAGGVGLFFFAGHGMQVKGTNYLIPVGADIKAEDEIRFKALDATEVLAKMGSAGNGLNLMILDACRNNPFGYGWRRGGAEGLAQMDAPTGTYIAFATAPGRTASDGPEGNGLFTHFLLEGLSQPGLKVEEVFKRVRVQVKQASKDQQVPWDSSSLTGDFFFMPAAAARVAGPAVPPPAHIVTSSWRTELGGLQFAFLAMLDEKFTRTMPASQKLESWRELRKAFADPARHATPDDTDLALIATFLDSRVAQASGSSHRDATWSGAFAELQVLVILNSNLELDPELLRTVAADDRLKVWSGLKQRLGKAPNRPEARGRNFDALGKRIADRQFFWMNRLAQSRN
jgi:hypothetical protein